MDTAALTDRLFGDALGALELFTVYIGERLGLYRALADDGPATSTELAGRTGTVERYVREWLEHHAASGLLAVDDPAAGMLERRYSMPDEHRAVLADADNLLYQAYRGVEMVRAARPLPDVVAAFRHGGAPPPLPWEPEGRAEWNRPLFLNLLGEEWLPAIADLDQRLGADPPARIADIACGTGWSSIAMAEAYPKATVDGFDLDPDAITLARRNAAEAGLSDRVAFHAVDAATLDRDGVYDLVTIIEALHDMERPVEVLAMARRLLADDGVVLVVDERVEDEFTAPAGELERMAYGWSVIACLPGAMGDPDTRATGAMMRPATLRGYAIEAGFADAEVLPIETDIWNFYRLRV